MRVGMRQSLLTAPYLSLVSVVVVDGMESEAALLSLKSAAGE